MSNESASTPDNNTGDAIDATKSSGSSPPTLTDEIRQQVVDLKLRFVEEVLNKRDRGTTDLGPFAPRFKELLDAFESVRVSILFKRLAARSAMASVAQSGELPQDLVNFEEALSTLEVVIGDMLTAVAIKKKLSLADGFDLDAADEVGS